MYQGARRPAGRILTRQQLPINFQLQFLGKQQVQCSFIAILDHGFYPARVRTTEVSGVENIGQCGRLSQLSWLLGAL